MGVPADTAMTGREPVDGGEGNAHLSVPFHLDAGLGPNRLDVMLVMCCFSLDLTGGFTIAISGTTFDVTRLDISGAPFTLHFAEDFPVWVTNLRIERDPAAMPRPGTLAGGGDRVDVRCEVPIRVTMQVRIEQETEWVTFRTPFTLAGTIHRSMIDLAGRFAFHLERYRGDRMSAKLGTCDVVLSASSLMHCRLDMTRSANTIRLAFAGREASLTVGGGFSIGLNGLDLRVIELALTASPLSFPGLLTTRDIEISLASPAAPVPVEFTLQPERVYHVRAAIPARLRTDLAFQGFAPQPFEAPLLLKLEGHAALGAVLRLSLAQQIEVAIGDGTIAADIEGDLVARIAMPVEPYASAAADPPRVPDVAPDVPTRTGEPVRSLAAVSTPPDRTARFVTIETLERRGGPSALPAIAAALQDPAPEVRRAAATALGRLGAREQAGALQAAFQHDSDDRVRLASMAALASLEVPAWPDVAAAAMRDPNETLRCQAALLLGRRGHPAAPDLLVEALADVNPFVRLSAGMGLMAAGKQQAIHSMVALAYEHEDICVQMICAIVLGQTQHEEARRALEHLLESSDDVFVRRAALYARAKQESGVAGRDSRPAS